MNDQKQGPVHSEAPTIEQLREVVTQAVSEALGGNFCKSPLTEDQLKESLHLYGMISDVGGGDLPKGIETIRENHKWVASLRKKGEKVGTTIIVLFITALGTGVIATFWSGFMSLFKGEG